jgi:hypothetical protein
MAILWNKCGAERKNPELAACRRQMLLLLKTAAPLPTALLTGHPIAMQTLYDSETYSVTHMLANAEAANQHPTGASKSEQSIKVPTLARHGFEIVDKRSGKEVYLDGSWAELFQQHIQAWQVNTPTQEEVEDTLEQYAELAQNPVVIH